MSSLLLRKEGAAGFVLLLFCFSLVFVRIFVPDWDDPSSDVDEEAIRQAFNEYASAVLSGDGNGDGGANGNGVDNVDGERGGGGDVVLKSVEIRSLFSRYGNLSHSEREAVAVWRLLRRVATRPDLFSQGKRAIAAAVSAWEEILHQVAEERQEGNDQEGKFRRQCCYSVEWNDSNLNKNNKRKKKNKGLVLSIPCGLILDSSINLIAVPRGTFAIRLAGSNKTILHYQVRFSNKSSSIIVQSSAGGLQETCPSTAASSTPKVDGFEACFLRSSSSSNSTNKQKQRLSWSTSVHSPFSLGLPFVASVWLGWHGFHATVNGRHVTSSRYHQEQEPWMVDTVEVDGRIDVYSFMATGLPAPENHKQPGLEYLKAPTISTPCILLVGVSSTANNFDRRMAIRRSWMQYESVRSGKVAVRFFVGLDKSSSVNSELWNEALAYKDIQLLPFIDQYELITLKTLAICIYGVKIVRSHFLMKADDDTFVRVDEVLSLVKDADPKTGLLLGLIEPSAMPNRDKSSKWYISEEEWPDPYYPPWAHGAGYLVSGEIGKHIVKSYEKDELKLFKLEDVAMGMWVVDYARLGKHVDYANHDKFFNLECASGYVIAHYQKPKDMLCLWQHLQKGEGAVCC